MLSKQAMHEFTFFSSLMVYLMASSPCFEVPLAFFFFE